MLSSKIINILKNVGVSKHTCNIIDDILYIIFTLIGVKFLCKKFLKVPLSELRITPVKINSIWIISAIAMPASVVFFAIVCGGHREIKNFNSLFKNL